jgi:hypothetical protein
MLSGEENKHLKSDEEFLDVLALSARRMLTMRMSFQVQRQPTGESVSETFLACFEVLTKKHPTGKQKN